VVIAGTGSIAYGRDAAGRTARAGGWGYVFGDEGGAFDIARQAVRAALRMEEGWGPPTALREALLDATGLASANQVLHEFYSPEWPRSRVAALAPLIDATATNGDSVALQILDRAAQDLALLAAAVRGQLWERGDAVQVAYVGGVFRSGRLLERFRMLVEFEEGNQCHAPIHGPAAGALLEAYRSEGLNLELSFPEAK
jgi:N-acetylglucosamine kinase